MRSITLVSLTEPGRALAVRLLTHLPQAAHLHRPQPFTETVQNRFRTGHRLILIGAMGIAVRTLAPILRDKYHDPAVLVMDEHGRFVVPLLSGHEGGANEWARQISEYIDATSVITGALQYTRPLLIAGLGCARDCPLAPLSQLLEQTLQEHGLTVGELHALASIELKQDEPAIHALAEKLSIPAVFYPAAILRNYHPRLSQLSPAVFRATGCYGVAEAAALAHAEHLVTRPAELLINKRKNAQATCAVARTYQDSEPSRSAPPERH